MKPPWPPGLPEWNEARVYEALVQGAGLADFEAMRQGSACLLRSHGVPSALIVNRVIGWGAIEPCTEAALDSILQDYGEAGFAIELAESAATDEVLQWLKARGLRKIATSQVMVRAGAGAGAGAGAAPAPRYAAWAQSTGLRVEPVGADALPTLARLSCENFKLPLAVGELLARGTQGPGWRRWLAFDGEMPVGASLSYVAEEVAWFGWTSVLPSHRGRWVHTGALARQLEDAEAVGCRWVSTETARGTPGRPDPVFLNLRRFGFAPAYLRPTFVKAPTRVHAAAIVA